MKASQWARCSLGVVALLGLVLVGACGTKETEGDATPAEVLSVVDGDTFRADVDGTEERVRLIGINAPEQGECLADDATALLVELLRNGPVLLEADVSDRDDFGRLLRYVHADETFVNAEMVAAGLALARRYEPDTSRAAELEDAQSRAQGAGQGMWSPDACGAAGAAEIEVSAIHPDAKGDDNENLNDEWVEFTNAGQAPVDLSGWSIRDESATHRFFFPTGFELEEGASVRLRSGCGGDTDSELHWCSDGSAVWNNSGDTVFVLDPHGNIVTSLSYRD